MNILGIDFGTKRIGLAWVDSAMGVVLPYGVVESGMSSVSDIADLVAQERIEKIVLGLPLGLDGKENDNTRAVRAFGEKLKAASVVPVEFFDERFSSRQADSTPGDVSRDEKAAMIVLQDYLLCRR